MDEKQKCENERFVKNVEYWKFWGSRICMFCMSEVGLRGPICVQSTFGHYVLQSMEEIWRFMENIVGNWRVAWLGDLEWHLIKHRIEHAREVESICEMCLVKWCAHWACSTSKCNDKGIKCSPCSSKQCPHYLNCINKLWIAFLAWENDHFVLWIHSKVWQLLSMWKTIHLLLAKTTTLPMMFLQIWWFVKKKALAKHSNA